MSVIDEMIAAFPGSRQENQEWSACIAACLECAQVCTSCADACLREDSVADLRRCVRTCSDCADVCTMTVAVLSRHTAGDHSVVRASLEACRTASAECASQCEQHASMHDHCRICAESCSRTEAACAALLAII